MLDGIIWFVQNLGLAVYNLFYAIFNPGLWLNWSNPEAQLKFVYYGGSVEFFFVVLMLVLVATVAGFIHRPFLWGCVRVLEAIGNTFGRVAAWAGLLMVLQQIVIVFIQRIFTRADLSFGFGSPLTFDVSWWSEELKLYNAIVVCLACTYTFIQGGHVRVDLVYAAVGYRTKKVIDMLGAFVFMMPMAILIWFYSWYFMWRHLITPKVSASDTLERSLLKARALKWNVETIGFSPNGFNAYFLFKVLMLVFAGLLFLQAVAFFYRCFLEWSEGPESEGRNLDKDVLGDPDAERVAEIH
jgi:TRAP-type mannitol/chloroaromatic compound transport system permease small subunit